MTDIVEITGDWIGFYTYDKGYNISDRQLKVPFRLTIERAINEFVGRIYEEADYGGIDDEIVIRGRQNGDEIEFSKYYTLEHFVDGDDNLVSVESDNPTIVYYRGKFDNRDKKFKGQWEIAGLRTEDDGVFQEDNQTGFWEIWRER
jgi:hypothetical protein